MEQNNIVATVTAPNPAFEIERDALAKAVAFMARHLVERRNTIPILSNVEIMVSAGAVRVRANDLDMMATITLPATVERPGITTLSAVTFADTLKKADGPYVRFDANGDGKALIACGRMRQNLNTLPADDFPVIAATEAKYDWLVECAELAGDWELVRPAISTEETRYYLNGICVDPTGGMLTYAATDGHRLSTVCRPLPVAEMEGQCIIPRKAVAMILQAIKGLPADAIGEMALNQTKLRFTAGNVEIYTKLIDGTFPDYTRIIPPACADTHILDVASAELATHCKAASGKPACLHMELGEKGSRAGQTNPEGRWAQSLAATYQGDECSIGFNARYLEQFAKLAPALQLAFNGADCPTRVTSPDLPHWQAVLMPMRLGAEELPAESVVEFAPVMAAPGQAADLFGVHTGVQTMTDKPRVATQDECVAYMTDYARRLGIEFDHVTGESLYSITLCDADGNELQKFGMPHAGAATVVTVETQDDEGNWSAPRPCLNAKGEVAAPVQRKERKAKAPKVKAATPIAVAQDPAPLPVESDAPAIIPADPMARDAIAAGRMEIIAVGTFDRLSPVEAPTALPDENGPLVSDNTEIAPAAPIAPEIDGNEAAPVCDEPADDPMAAIMARLEAIEARLAGEPDATPIDATDTPIAAQKRSPARERMIRRYLAMRAERKRLRASIQSEIAINVNTREKFWAQQDARRAMVKLAWEKRAQAMQAKRDLEREKAKRARLIERSRANHRLARKQIAAKHELLTEMFRMRADQKAMEADRDRRESLIEELRGRCQRAESELAVAKASPTYMDTEGREFADARAMAMQRATEAVERAERIAERLATAEATVKRQAGAIDAMEGKMMEMTGRALRAENALEAIQARIERDGKPYVMGAPTVRFRRAA